MRLIAKMPSKKADEQYLLLQRIGRVKEAIDLAYDRKDADALEDILSTLLDVNMIAYCNEKMNLLKRWFYNQIKYHILFNTIVLNCWRHFVRVG